MSLIKFIKDTLCPKRCYSCNIEWCFLCSKCFLELDNYLSLCYACKMPNDNFNIHNDCNWIHNFDKTIILTHYKNKVIKKMVIASKYFHRKDVLEDFWDYLSKLFTKHENIANRNDFLIIPVPMYFWRKMQRWYNHSEKLANKIANNLKIKVDIKIIKRVKNTRQQSLLSKEERLVNLRNAFKINKKHKDIVDKKNIILVDDIISTWTTLDEISKVLKKNWAKRVIWLCVASD